MLSTTAGRAALLLALLALLAAAAPAPAAAQSFGFGLHHWQTVKDLMKRGFHDIDEKGTSAVIGYQTRGAGPFRMELDLEYFASGFGGANDAAWSPQLYVLVGHRVYAGLGTGILYSKGFVDGKYSDPFYAARLGLELAVVPRLSLDVHGEYRFDDWNQLDNADTDTVTLGAMLRVRI
jgi:hypothetical protein